MGFIVDKPFYQKLVPAAILVLLLAFITLMAMSAPRNNPFPTQDAPLDTELEFQDGQMGFVGISGTTWKIFSDGTCQASRFVNDTVSSPHQTCHLDQQDLVLLANTLSDQSYADLPFQISSEPTLNPHRLTIRLGEKSSTLVLKTGESIENALTALHHQHETPRSRFLTIAQAIDRLIQQNCRDEQNCRDD
ncbi:MAG: hypothetical protein HY785_28490 [Oscillatoriophycideae cyanobacterium NC_groundwater_1537_Pr4_S-0.65um_50_18]|nr:hypothetical protein [Oscillatoriophycideae cyanobacterium NC_groundwater_1537_Pr4_S-0.65um_50_18]